MNKQLRKRMKFSGLPSISWRVWGLSFTVFSLMIISSCEEQEKEPLIVADLPEKPVDDRLVGMEATLWHINPATGAPYTNEELAGLPYNPWEEEYYNPGTDFEISIVSQLEPQQIQVLIGDNEVLEDLAIPAINSDDEYVSTYSSSFDILGFGSGEERILSFAIVYNNADASQPASVQTLDYKFHMANIRPRALAFLKKSDGEILEIKTQVSGASSMLDDAYGHIFTFDGADDYLTLIDSDDLAFRNAGDFSISIWINTTSSNDDPVIIGDKDWGSGGNKGFLFAHIGEKWKLNLGDGASGRKDLTGGVINDGVWHHLAATFDRDGDVVIYQDGVEMGRTDLSSTGDMTSGFPIRLAQDGTAGYGKVYEGMTGEPIIFDYVLSDGEIAGLNENNLDNNTQLRKQDGTYMALPIINSSVDPVAELVNSRERFVRTFNGSSEYATIDDAGSLDFRHTGNYSVAIWVNTTISNSDPVFIGDKDWNSGGNKGFLLVHNNDEWRLNLADGNGNRIDVKTDGSEFNDGEWHLLAATIDRSGEAVIYQDGEIWGSADISSFGDMDSGYPVRIAQDGTGTYGYWYEGSTSTAYMFDYALSAEEMLLLYNE